MQPLRPETANGANCKNNEFVLASQCSKANCPTELPDWGSGTGDDSGSSGDSSGTAGTDAATGQFKLNSTNHGNLALNLNPNNLLNDVKAVMNETSYDDASAHAPLYKMGCSFHPQWRNQVGMKESANRRTRRCSSGGPRAPARSA
ncbi:hypothetical protein BLSTO_06315 [Blastocystis sp. subtype 1]